MSIMRSVFLLAVTLCVLPVFPACSMQVNMDGGDILTDCPLVHPDKPDVKLDNGRCLSGDGEDLSAPPDFEYRENGWNYYFQFYLRGPSDYAWYDQCKLLCEYQDGSEITIPIPGELVSSGGRFRTIKPPPDPVDECGRIWAESRRRKP